MTAPGERTVRRHRWVLQGGGGGWEVWQCLRCDRSAIPFAFGLFWPWPRCKEVSR